MLLRAYVRAYVCAYKCACVRACGNSDGRPSRCDGDEADVGGERGTVQHPRREADSAHAELSECAVLLTGSLPARGAPGRRRWFWRRISLHDPGGAWKLKVRRTPGWCDVVSGLPQRTVRPAPGGLCARRPPVAKLPSRLQSFMSGSLPRPRTQQSVGHAYNSQWNLKATAFWASGSRRFCMRIRLLCTRHCLEPLA